MSRRGAVRAPALVGRRWAGGGALPLPLPLPLRLSGVGAPLSGRVVVLHFFTAGCVNCAHAHAELRALVAAHPRALVLGVHSPKFPHEATVAGLDAAIVRADLEHPVLDDTGHETWSAYAVGAWPTIVVVDAGGYVAQTFVGEGHGAATDALVGDLLGGPVDAGGPADDTAAPADLAAPVTGAALSSPASALALPGGRVVVADPGHHRLVVLDAATAVVPGSEPLSVIGGLDAPAGMTLLPPDAAARVGWDLAVADAGAHTVVGVRLADGSVRAVAGTGEPLRPDAPARERGGPALAGALSSPLDVAWCAGVLVVAMSGVHQLWALDVAADPGDGRLTVIAGTGSEGLLDGEGPAAMLAQPSALAPDERSAEPGGHGLWFVDAESSSLRHVQPPAVGSAAAWEVTTVVGTGVHAFGDRDGDAASALMQHPLGVTVAGDGAVLVADTYNGAVRRVDVGARRVTTVVDRLAEPVALVVVSRGSGEEELLVVESAAHRLSAVVLAPAVALTAGPLEVTVRLAVPADQHLDDADGAPVRLDVVAHPPGLLVGPGEPARSQDPTVWTTGVSLTPGSGVLAVTARVATCDAADSAAGAACHLHQRTWQVPVVVEQGDASAAPRPIDLGWVVPPGSAGR